VPGRPVSVHKVIVFPVNGKEIVPELTWPMYQGQSASDAAIFGACGLDFDFEPSSLWHPLPLLMGEGGGNSIKPNHDH
jgi:hypothetical protein